MKLKFCFGTAVMFMAMVAFLPGHAQQNTSMPNEVPLFTLSDFEGNEYSLESLRGKVVLINFWATWCAPCIEEMPTLDNLKKAFSDQPFEILAVNMGEESEAISVFAERIGIDFSFPLLVDELSQVAHAYQVSALPASLVVDKMGRFAFGGVGVRAWDSDEVKSEIQPYLDQTY